MQATKRKLDVAAADSDEQGLQQQEYKDGRTERRPSTFNRTQTDEETLVAPFIERMKKHVREVTEKPYGDLKSPFHNPGEGPRRDLRLDEIFTNLIVYEGRAEYDFSGDRVKQLNEYVKANECLRATLPGDIFDRQEQKILVVGRRGIGKTMLGTKILRHWASDSLFNETQKSQMDFKVAFLVKLSMFNSRIKNLNLRELLDHSEYSTALSEELWDYICNNPERVLLIFDGFDEYSFRTKIDEDDSRYRNSAEERMPVHFLLKKIVSGKMLTGANFIICGCLLELLGNTTGLTILPTRLTEIYSIAVRMFYFTYDDDQYRHNKTEGQQYFLKPFKELPSSVQNAFARLGKIAFDGVKKGHLIFESHEVNDLEGNGLFHRLPDFRDRPLAEGRAQYCFLHLTVQEFLAAKYLVDTLSSKQLRDFVSAHIQDGAWEVVMQFVAGLQAEKEGQSTDIFSDLLPSKTVTKDIDSVMSEGREERAERVPSDILARGSLATEVYNRELKEGYGYARRVPIMIIGQARTGKTSLKKSLKGELFDPNEGSTEGIETDPSYFKVTTDVWRTGQKRTGSNSEDTDTKPEFLVDRQLAQNIFNDLKEKGRLEDPSTSGTKPSVKEPSEANSPPTERSEESSSKSFEPSLQDSKAVESAKAPSLRTEASVEPEELKTSSSVKEQIESDPSTQKVPENVAAMVQELLKDHKKFMEGDDMYSVIWDFGGQSVFYDTHPIFLTEKAIYILACDLSRDPYKKADTPVKQGMYKEIEDTDCQKTNFDYLDFWMSSIYSLVSKNTNRQKTSSPQTLPSVFLACTHADEPYTKKGNPSKEIYGALKDKIYGDLLKGFFVVDNTKSGSDDECQGVKKLRESVRSVAKKLPQMKEKIPLKWLKYEKVLYLLMSNGRQRIFIEEARQIASDECGIDDDVKFRTVLNFLHDQKVLINFNELPELESMVILNPQWLVDVFKEVITFKSFNPPENSVESFNTTENSVERLWKYFETTGILDRKVLDHAWGRFIDDQDTCKNLIAIMERFSLLCPWPSEGTTEQYLVPSMLRSPPTGDALKLLASSQIPSLYVRFESRRVPPGLFSRLILLFHHWVQDKSKRPKIPKLFNNFALFHIFPHDAISVILLCHSSSIEIVFHVADVTRAEEEAFIHERYLNASRDIHRQLRLFLERMRNEFFWLKHMRYETCVSCPVCSLQTECSKCRDHGVRGCDCLHLLSELELQEYPYCDSNVVCADCRIHKEMFVHWFAFSNVQESRIALTQREDVTGRNQSGKNFTVSTRETASQRPTTDPPDVIIDQLKSQDLPDRSTHLDDCQLPVDILLLTVEDCEFRSCLSYLNPGFCKTFRSGLGYLYLGDMGKDERKQNVAVMSCYRGSASAGGSTVVVLNAVKVLRPKAVFCVGSCKSLDCNKVKLGDVVVLEKLITYGPCKITEGGIEEGGVRVPLNSGLLKVILRAGDGWQPPLKDLDAREVEIHRGAFLSGPEEVIDRKRCEALLERFPEVVAIEREGEGVYTAAHDLGIEWTVIKGISGYADGRNVSNSWRRFASLMAASLMAHILSDAIPFQDMPHYRNETEERGDRRTSCKRCKKVGNSGGRRRKQRKGK